MKTAILAFVFVSTLTSFASARTGNEYKMSCVVYGRGASASAVVSPKSGDDISIYKKGEYEYFAGATEMVTPPSTDVSVQFYLTITKNGETIAQSMSDYQAPKSFAVLRATNDIPEMSCISIH